MLFPAGIALWRMRHTARGGPVGAGTGRGREARLTDRGDLRVNHRITVPADELEERFVQASGPGGQNVNKVATAVQLRFRAAASAALPAAVRDRAIALAGARASADGTITIDARRTRSQSRNRAEARERLCALLLEAAQPPPPPRRRTRPTRGSVERRLKAKGERGRTKALRARPAED